MSINLIKILKLELYNKLTYKFKIECEIFIENHKVI